MSVVRSETTGPDFNSEGFYKHFGDLLGPLFEEIGISAEVLTDPNARVPLSKHCRLMELAAERQGDGSLGLKIGYRKKTIPRNRFVVYPRHCLDRKAITGHRSGNQEA